MKKIFPLVLISIGVAMISVLSQFTLPFGPIPLTLQTLMIGIIGTIYKPSHAFVTVCLYLLLGFLGFPVFAGGAGGASHFLGPTAGFLVKHGHFDYFVADWILGFDPFGPVEKIVGY